MSFDLSEALDGPLDIEETGCESRCLNMTDVRDGVFEIDEGLSLVVSHNPKTFQSVANLLLAVNRMKNSLSHRSTELSDRELCSAIMEGLVTETVVETTGNSSSGVQRTFQRLNSVKLCTLCDMSQKDVVQATGELKLQAVTLKGGNSERKVDFKLFKYITSCSSAADSLTVVLSIANNLHISVCMMDGSAVLTLEECSEENLKRISAEGNMDRFLFYKETIGDSMNTFESVKYRGWFISTSIEGENLPLEMCKVDAASRLKCFRLN
ncbi:interleukin-1 beta isoform X2 [Centropristis striata]|uniref:interleukin-1 beta isoform X2 n=1 Tax=Centropristis striata TaxID=184440 RepID=UPI0027DEB75C|nr:interleukin-1 beta isoform X2 [Centropristis striata]